MMGLTGIDWVTDQEIVEGYLSDASNTKGFCDGVYRPKDVKELSEVLKHCNDRNVSVTITAQRTATTGAPVPHGGGLISMENFTKIHSATEVDANVILGTYQKELARRANPQKHHWGRHSKTRDLTDQYTLSESDIKTIL